MVVTWMVATAAEIDEASTLNDPSVIVEISGILFSSVTTPVASVLVLDVIFSARVLEEVALGVLIVTVAITLPAANVTEQSCLLIVASRLRKAVQILSATLVFMAVLASSACLVMPWIVIAVLTIF